VLELTLLRLTRPETATDTEALASRMERLERGAASRESRVASPEPPAAASPKGEETEGDETDDSQRANKKQPPSPPVSSPGGGGAERSEAEGALAVLPPKGGEKEDEAVPSPPGGGAERSEAEGADSPAEKADVTLAEFRTAWPQIVARVRAELGARRHAFVKVAEPVAIENGVAVLTLPAHQHFHLEQLNADRELHSALADIATELLGGRITLEFRSDDTPPPSAEADTGRAPDKDRLVEEGSAPNDPADLIADMLGGEVVSE